MTAWKKSAQALEAYGRRRPMVPMGHFCVSGPLRYDARAMAQGHSVDEYLRDIYFLAFPIGEYRPRRPRSRHSPPGGGDAGVSRASAGEMLKRLEADGLVERGEHKEAILTAAGRGAPSGACASTGSSSGS